MKIFLLLYSFLYSFNDSSLYSISFEQADGRVIEMSSFKGKRFMVVVVDPKRPDIAYLDHIHSIARSASVSPHVIAVPASDLEEGKRKTAAPSAFTTLNKSITLSRAVDAGKRSAQQHPLLKWLTHVEGNRHFDRDIEDGLMFMINEKGVLYGVHNKQLSPKLLKEVMEQEIKQQDSRVE